MYANFYSRSLRHSKCCNRNFTALKICKVIDKCVAPVLQGKSRGASGEPAYCQKQPLYRTDCDGGRYTDAQTAASRTGAQNTARKN